MYEYQKVGWIGIGFSGYFLSCSTGDDRNHWAIGSSQGGRQILQRGVFRRFQGLVGATNDQAYALHILLIAISYFFSILFDNRVQRLTLKLVRRTVRKAISHSFSGLVAAPYKGPIP